MLLLALLPGALRAEELADLPPPGAGQSGLLIRCAKTDLYLGREREVEVRVEGPANASALALSAQIGTFKEIKRTAPGRWTARYQLPEKYFPQVALLAARATVPGSPKTLTGWQALRLWGSGEAVVKTRASSMVKLEIKGKLFGPVKANRRGVALVPVMVPPGVDHGYNGTQRVDLNLPPSRRLHVVLSRKRTDGARPAKIELFLFAVRDDAVALERAPQVSFPDGRPTPLQRLGPGAWRGEIEVPAGATAKLPVRISLRDAPSSTVELQIARTRAEVAQRPPPPEPPPPPPPTTKRSGPSPIYFWSALALSSSLLVAGTITRLVALEMSAEYLDETTTIERRKELKPTGESLTTFSSVALGVGAASMVGTAVLYWLTDFSGPEVTVGLQPERGTGHIALSGRF